MIARMLSSVSCVLTFAVLALAEQEHKVHNIILYPEKHSWCQLTPIKQVISSPGYESVTIDNNICVGGCFSYSIPRTQPPEPGEQIQPYCDSCQPSAIECYHVTLQSDGDNIDRPLTFQKRIEIIVNCSCMSCANTHDSCDTILATAELPSTLLSANADSPSRHEDVPELLDFQSPPHHLNLTNERHRPAPNPAHKYTLKPITIELLRRIENNEPYDRHELGDLLEIIEGHRKSLTYARLIDFTNYIESSEDVEIDPHKLKKVLEEFLGVAGTEAERRRFQQNADWMQDLSHHHRLGEEVRVGSEAGRLVEGPHGSKVMANSVKVEVDPENLTPNQDGLVISYENSPHNSNKTPEKK